MSADGVVCDTVEPQVAVKEVSEMTKKHLLEYAGVTEEELRPKALTVKEIVNEVIKVSDWYRGSAFDTGKQACRQSV
jgi:hypothetical protein